MEQLLQPLGADELGGSGLTFVGGTHSGLTFGLTSERVLTGLTSERVLAGLTSERVLAGLTSERVFAYRVFGCLCEIVSPTPKSNFKESGILQQIRMTSERVLRLC